MWGGREVSHCVHAAMDRDQAPGFQPARDLLGRQTRGEKLLVGDDSVLAGRDHGGRVQLMPHTGVNCTRAKNSPPTQRSPPRAEAAPAETGDGGATAPPA